MSVHDCYFGSLAESVSIVKPQLCRGAGAGRGMVADNTSRAAAPTARTGSISGRWRMVLAAATEGGRDTPAHGRALRSPVRAPPATESSLARACAGDAEELRAVVASRRAGSPLCRTPRRAVLASAPRRARSVLRWPRAALCWPRAVLCWWPRRVALCCAGVRAVLCQLRAVPASCRAVLASARCCASSVLCWPRHRAVQDPCCAGSVSCPLRPVPASRRPVPDPCRAVPCRAGSAERVRRGAGR
jgi:hypothetical protein